MVRRSLARRRRTTPSDVLYRLYVVALFSLPVGYVAVQPVGVPVPSATATAIHEVLLAWVPVAVVAIVAAAARFAAWAGLVVLHRGELTWLLTAPVRRVELLRPRVVRAVSTAAAAGALVGYASTLPLVAELDRPPGPLLAAGIGAGGCVGLLAAGAMWWVQGSSQRARAVVRITPCLLTVAIAAGAAANQSSLARDLLGGSGPWGWVARPVAAAAGAPVDGGIAALLLAATSLTVGVVTIVRADAVSLAEHARRASAAHGVHAAIFTRDLPFAASLRHEAMRGLLGVPPRRLPRPRHAWLAVPWTDALGLLRAPRWLVTGAVTGLALHATATVDATSGMVVPGLLPLGVGAVGGALAASQVIDGLRAEHGSLLGLRYLPWPPPRIVASHLITPLAALLCTIGVAATVTRALGTASSATIGVAVLGAVLATPVLLGGAALVATTPDLEPGALLSVNGAALSVALTRPYLGPQLAVLVVVLAGAGVLAARSAGAPAGAAGARGVACLLLVATGMAVGLRRRSRRIVAAGCETDDVDEPRTRRHR